MPITIVVHPYRFVNIVKFMRLNNELNLWNVHFISALCDENWKNNTKPNQTNSIGTWVHKHSFGNSKHCTEFCTIYLVLGFAVCVVTTFILLQTN